MRIARIGTLTALLAGGCGRAAPEPPAAPEPQPVVTLAPVVEPRSPPQAQAQAPIPSPPGSQPIQSQPDPDSEIPTVERVCRITPRPGCVKRFVGVPTEFEETVARWGARAFPAYAAILADAASDPWDVIGVCEATEMVRDERRQFIPLLVRRLTDPDAMVSPQTATKDGPLASLRGEVRVAAIYLLGEIGSAHDTVHIRPFLFDDASGVRYAVLQSLARIGGQRDLDALNLWLDNPPLRANNNLVRKVQEARDALNARLQADPARWKV